MEKFIISNDPGMYEAWPDVAIAPNGELVCVFSECTHHMNRTYTRVMLASSADRGRTWTPKIALTEDTEDSDFYYNCARIGTLRDKRMFVIVDKVPKLDKAKLDERTAGALAENVIYFSDDSGRTWGEPVVTPLNGIVPDRLLELENGRWIIAAHHHVEGEIVQFLRYSDDRGETWSGKIVVGQKKGFNLCEASILPMGDKTLVAFMRENSFMGYDCMKTISRDNGETWSEVIDFPLPGCHRPVARHLRDGRILVTFRLLQGGKAGFGTGAQNFCGALTDVESALAPDRRGAQTRIFPIDYDRSARPDLGYSGHVQFDDGEIYVVNYIVDDAGDKGHIRGYAMSVDDLFITSR
jgi:sialidase-1